MQQMTINLTISIPADFVLITKVEYDQLKELQLEGVYWMMRDLENRINKKSEWIKDHILYKSQFRKKLDSRLNGVLYLANQTNKETNSSICFYHNFHKLNNFVSFRYMIFSSSKKTLMLSLFISFRIT